MPRLSLEHTLGGPVAKVRLEDTSSGPDGACRRAPVDGAGLEVALWSRETATLLMLRVFTQRNARERLDWSIARRCRGSSSGLPMRGAIILVPHVLWGRQVKLRYLVLYTTTY